MRNLSMTAVATAALMLAAACESSGHTRYASVGTVGPQGATGAPGKTGPQGEQGPAGPAGEDGGNVTLGDTGMIATGGLVGPDGLAGTGLLANLGDPNTTMPAGGETLTGTGTLLASTSTQLDGLLTEAGLPAELTNLTGAVTDTTANIGTALVDAGTDGAPLVDGLTSSLSPLLSVGAGNGSVAGDGSDSLIGASLLSGDQASGTLLEAGIGAGDTLIGLDAATDTDTGMDLAGLVSADLGPVTENVGTVLDQAGLTDLTDITDLGGLDQTGLTDLTAPVEDLLSGSTTEDNPVQSLLGGLLGGN
jgi:hypothetical protein